MASTVIRSCISFLLLALAACASTTPPQQLQSIQPPPSEELRASLGTVGVVSVATNPKLDQRGTQTGPGFGSGALHGLGDWTRVTHAGLNGGNDEGLGLLVFIAGLPVAGVVGGVNAEAENYKTAHADGDVNELGTTFRKVLAVREPQRELRERVVAQASTVTTRKIIDIGSGSATNPTKKADYTLYVQKGAETALEVGVRAITITVVNNSADLYLTLSVTGRARLIDVSNNQVLWSDEKTDSHTVSHHRLFDWKAGDDALVKSEVDRGLDEFAREINHKVFLEGHFDQLDAKPNQSFK